MNELKQTKAREIFARILAAENVQIVYSSDAKTASYNPRKRIIELPTTYLTAAQTSAADMFLLHECMHAMETPKNMLSKARKLGAGFPDMCNLIEDVRIDRCGIALYPAARKLNAAGVRELNDAGFFGSKLQPPAADDLMANLFAYRLTAAGYTMPYNLPAQIETALNSMSKAADVYKIAQMIMKHLAPKAAAKTQAAAQAAAAQAAQAAQAAEAGKAAAEAGKAAAEAAADCIEKTEAARDAQAAADAAMIAAAEAAKAAEAAAAGDNKVSAQAAEAARDAAEAARDAQKAAREARRIASEACANMPAADAADKIRAAAEAAAQSGDEYAQGKAQAAADALAKGEITSAADFARDAIFGEISAAARGRIEQIESIGSRPAEVTEAQRIAAADKLTAAAQNMTRAAAGGVTAAFIPYAAAEAAYLIDAKRAAKIVFDTEKPKPEMTRAGRVYEAPEAHFAADISAMVTEFNRRKAAHAAAMTSRKTAGRVDTRRLAKYKVTDDIFRRNTIKPAGKNHAVILLLDMSSSMGNQTLQKAADAMQVIAEFCRREGIAAEFYGYTTFSQHRYMRDDNGGKAGDYAIYNNVTTSDKPARCTRDSYEVLRQIADNSTAPAMMAALRAYYNAAGCHSVAGVVSSGCTPTCGAYSHLPAIIENIRGRGYENVTVIDITDGVAGDCLNTRGGHNVTAVSYRGIVKPVMRGRAHNETIAALIAAAHNVTFARIFIDPFGGEDFIEKRENGAYSHDLVYYPNAQTSGDAISALRGRRIFAQTIGGIIGDAAFGGVK